MIATSALLAIVTIILIVWTSIKAGNSTPGDTVSEVIRYYCANSLLLSAFLGTLFGHWLWPNPAYHPPVYIKVGVLTMMGFIWLGLDLHYWIREPQIAGLLGVLRKYPIITFSIHLIIGHWFFPMN